MSFEYKLETYVLYIYIPIEMIIYILNNYLAVDKRSWINFKYVWKIIWNLIVTCYLNLSAAPLSILNIQYFLVE